MGSCYRAKTAGMVLLFSRKLLKKLVCPLPRALRGARQFIGYDEASCDIRLYLEFTCGGDRTQWMSHSIFCCDDRDVAAVCELAENAGYTKAQVLKKLTAHGVPPAVVLDALRGRQGVNCARKEAPREG